MCDGLENPFTNQCAQKPTCDTTCVRACADLRRASPRRRLGGKPCLQTLAPQYTVYSTRYTVHSIQYTMYSTQNTEYNTQYTVHNAR